MEGFGGVSPSSGLVVFQIQIRKHIKRRGNDVGFIKTDRQWAAGDFFVVINLPTVALGRAGFGLPFFTIGQHLPTEPKVPFTDHRRMIPLLPQETGHG